MAEQTKKQKDPDGPVDEFGRCLERKRLHQSKKSARKSRSRSGSRSEDKKLSRIRNREKDKDKVKDKDKDKDEKRKRRSISRDRVRRSRSPIFRSRSPPSPPGITRGWIGSEIGFGRKWNGHERRDVMLFTPRCSPPKDVPEYTIEERDDRTVCVMKLSKHIRPRDLETFFSSAGKVRDVRIIMDPVTHNSKGVGYIEFWDLASVSKGVALSGQSLFGVPIIVHRTLSEKNRGLKQVYVGNLHNDVTPEVLRGIFEPFGKIVHIEILEDFLTKRPKGFGFVTFYRSDDAERAMERLNGFNLGGRSIRVNHATKNRSIVSDQLSSGSDSKTRNVIELSSGVGKSEKATIDSGTSAPASTDQPVAKKNEETKLVSSAQQIWNMCQQQILARQPQSTTIPLVFGVGAAGLASQSPLIIPTVAQSTQGAKNRTTSIVPPTRIRLYVGSLHDGITEDMLREIFQIFGKVDSVQIIKDRLTNLSQGYGFITFHNEEEAKCAIEHLNGFELGGRPMQVRRSNEYQPKIEPDRSSLESQLTSKVAEDTGVRSPLPLINQILNMCRQVKQETVTEQRREPTVACSIATQCIKLSNMFDPLRETGDSWADEIKDDLEAECKKHGSVQRVFVDKNSLQGRVYIKCSSLVAASALVKALHGICYKDRVITAQYVPISSMPTEVLPKLFDY